MIRIRVARVELAYHLLGPNHVRVSRVELYSAASLPPTRFLLTEDGWKPLSPTRL